MSRIEFDLNMSYQGLNLPSIKQCVFCCTCTEATKMWKDLVDTYQRKIKSGSSREPLDEKASNWRFFNRMSFLKSFIGGRK